MRVRICQECGKNTPDGFLRCPECGAIFATDGTDRIPAIAEQVGLALGEHYRVEELIGKGGAAIVFRVRDERLQRSLAVKVLNPELLASAELAGRFRREAQTAAALNHPNIVPIFFVGGHAQIPCYAMPLIEGESLGARIRREGQLSVDVAVAIAKDIAAALDFAHGANVIHRDVKPDNILLDFTTGRSLLMDFGIAKALQDSDADLTQSGMVMGTPHYLSPEQASGEKDIDGRADVYSLGVVVFEMLAGRPPFTGATPQAIFAQHVSAELPGVGEVRPGVPRSIEDVLAKATAKAPGGRYNRAGDFVRALERAYGRRSLRTSGDTAVGMRSPSETNLFRAFEVNADEPALRALAEAETFTDLAEAAENVERYIHDGASHGDWARVADGIRVLRRRARDLRPAFRDPTVRVLERISEDSAVVEALATGWKNGDEQAQARLEEALTASPGLAGHLLDLAIRERSAELMLLADRVGALTEGRVDTLARDNRIGVVHAFVTGLRESVRPAHLVERWLTLVLQHPRLEVRRLAVEAAAFRGGALAERIGRLALGAGAAEVRLAALRALGASRRREALPDLAQFLEHGRRSEQVAAVEAMADLGAAAAAPALSRVFERKRLFWKERGPVQEAAAEALTRLPLEASGDTLRALTGDRNRRIARIATAAMGAVRESEAASPK